LGYVWDFSTPLRSIDLLLWGTLDSIKLAVLSMLLAAIAGGLTAAMRMSRWRLLSIPARLYIDFFRSTAILILIFWCYFALPVLVNIEIDPFRAALLAIGLQAAAYFAELARGAIQSVDKGQWEAATALGMRSPTALRLVVLPQAIRRMIPVTFNLAIVVFKNTSLAAAISYTELSYQASLVSTTTYRPIETYTIIAFIYLAIITSASVFSNYLERRFSVEASR